jgi:hypothetical protein
LQASRDSRSRFLGDIDPSGIIFLTCLNCNGIAILIQVDIINVQARQFVFSEAAIVDQADSAGKLLFVNVRVTRIIDSVKPTIDSSLRHGFLQVRHCLQRDVVFLRSPNKNEKLGGL